MLSRALANAFEGVAAHIASERGVSTQRLLARSALPPALSPARQDLAGTGAGAWGGRDWLGVLLGKKGGHSRGRHQRGHCRDGRRGLRGGLSSRGLGLGHRGHATPPPVCNSLGGWYCKGWVAAKLRALASLQAKGGGGIWAWRGQLECWKATGGASKPSKKTQRGVHAGGSPLATQCHSSSPLVLAGAFIARVAASRWRSGILAGDSPTTNATLATALVKVCNGAA